MRILVAVTGSCLQTQLQALALDATGRGIELVGARSFCEAIMVMKRSESKFNGLLTDAALPYGFPSGSVNQGANLFMTALRMGIPSTIVATPSDTFICQQQVEIPDRVVSAKPREDALKRGFEALLRQIAQPTPPRRPVPAAA